MQKTKVFGAIGKLIQKVQINMEFALVKKNFTGRARASRYGELPALGFASFSYFMMHGKRAYYLQMLKPTW